MVKIGQKLKTLRRINNITPDQVIDTLEKMIKKKFSTSSLYKWEENMAEPNIYTLIALSHIYHTSVSFILDDSIIKLENISPLETSLLKLFRHNKHFMQITSDMLKYCTNN